MVSPTGLALPQGSKPSVYTVGRKIGSGAQGTVYTVLDEHGKETSVCVKLTAVRNATKKKKETDSLYLERLAYASRFPALRGSMIPRLPIDMGSKVPLYGEVQGTS